MKKYLLPKTGKFYKANLHCHTTCSDGKLTPEQIKEAYKSRGYSVVAYTDHYLIVPHDELTDESFVALNAYEMEVHDTRAPNFRVMKNSHMCLIALKPDNIKQVCYHRSKYCKGNMLQYRDKAVIDESLPDYEREHEPDIISDMMRIGRENGFFVTYNHPTWSLDDYRDYANYHNMHAMEIYNYNAYVAGFEEENGRVYDDMLRCGKRIYCIGVDDNHNGRSFDDLKCDSFGAYTMIKAEKLEYTAITDALMKGNFYASMGPQIKELWFEGGEIHIKTSPADRILMRTGYRGANSVYREKGKSLTYAHFPVDKACVYVRLTVVDKHGKRADTNAFFTDELYDEQ